jgi:short subunit dehydrogenase-like uncharacterized protein
LAGRDRSALAALAGTLGCEWRCAPLEEPGGLREILGDAGVVLNCAGPFARTAVPLAGLCVETRTHYLDLSGEARSIAAVATLDGDALRKGVMLMPAVGFEVVAGDCAAAHAWRRLPAMHALAIAVSRPGALTLGSVRTLIEAAGDGLALRAGALAPVPLASIERQFDFGRGRTPCLNVSLAHVVTAWHSTGVAHVTGFVEAGPTMQAMLRGARAFGHLWSGPVWRPWFDAWARLVPRDAFPLPSTDALPPTVVVEGDAADGRRVEVRLRTPEPYAFTTTVALSIAQRVLRGDVEPGFQTPSRVFGPDFVLAFDGVTREDLR